MKQTVQCDVRSMIVDGAPQLAIAFHVPLSSFKFTSSGLLVLTDSLPTETVRVGANASMCA